MNNNPNNLSDNSVINGASNVNNNPVNGPVPGVTPNPNPTVGVPNPTPSNPVTPDNQVMLGGSSAPQPTPQPSPVQQPVNPTPVVSPTEAPQAFTNPQTINPVGGQTQGVPGATPNPNPSPAQPQTVAPAFESSSQIGTTPPISLEPDKKPKKKMNGTVFALIVIVALAAVGFGTFYVLRYTDLLKKKPNISILTNPVIVSLGEELPEDIEVYASVNGTAVSNCTKDVSKVNPAEVGVYEYTIKCGTTEKKGSITIVDNTELAIEVQTLYKIKGETVEAKDFVKNANNNVTYEFTDQTAVDNALAGDIGTYNFKIKGTDTKSNKTAEVDVKLVILQYAIKGYLICESNTQNIPNSAGEMIVNDRFAIADDTTTNTNNIYNNLAFETYTFKFSDETEYKTYVDTYNNEGKIIINDITGDTTFDDANKTIIITKELDNNTIKGEYGEENLKSYGSIKDYFEKTKGYTCTYEKNE